MIPKSWLAAAALFAASFCSSSCASVPPEAVELSQAVGNDIQTVRTSYEGMIKRFFEGQRKRVDTLLTEKWAPAFIKDYIVSGKLIEDAENGDTIGVQLWARAAIEEIDKKRKEEFDRIDARETALLQQVRALFEQMTAANAAATAHLNSVVKVHAAQDKVLETIGAEELRNRINEALIHASNEMDEATLRIDDLTKKLQE